MKRYTGQHVSTFDDGNVARHGQTVTEVTELDNAGTVEVRFEDGEWILATTDEVEDVHPAQRVLDADAEEWLAAGVRRVTEAGLARWITHPDDGDPNTWGLQHRDEHDPDRVLLVVYAGVEDFEHDEDLELLIAELDGYAAGTTTPKTSGTSRR